MPREGFSITLKVNWNYGVRNREGATEKTVHHKGGFKSENTGDFFLLEYKYSKSLS